MRIWISALIPAHGADTYDGVRLQASLSEEDCYRDLAEWLEIEYESNVQVAAALDAQLDVFKQRSGYELDRWKVEAQEVTA